MEHGRNNREYQRARRAEEDIDVEKCWEQLMGIVRRADENEENRRETGRKWRMK